MDKLDLFDRIIFYGFIVCLWVSLPMSIWMLWVLLEAFITGLL